MSDGSRSSSQVYDRLPALGQDVICHDMQQCRAGRIEFELRRLDRLLKFYEHPANGLERSQSAEAVCRALRLYLYFALSEEGNI